MKQHPILRLLMLALLTDAEVAKNAAAPAKPGDAGKPGDAVKAGEPAKTGTGKQAAPPKK